MKFSLNFWAMSNMSIWRLLLGYKNISFKKLYSKTLNLNLPVIYVTMDGERWQNSKTKIIRLSALFLLILTKILLSEISPGTSYTQVHRLFVQ